MAGKVWCALRALVLPALVIGLAFGAGLWAARPRSGAVVTRGPGAWIEVRRATSGELCSEWRPPDGATWAALDTVLRDVERRPLPAPVKIPAGLEGTPEAGCGPPLPDPRAPARPTAAAPRH